MGADVHGDVVRRHDHRGRGRGARGREAKARLGGRPRRPSARPARPARSPAWRRPKARSRAPWPPRTTWRSPGYDKLTADEITSKFTELSQIDLAKIDSYERKNQNRTTVLSRITSLRADEPWAGYDELTASEIQAVLAEGDDERAKDVRPTSAPQEPRRRPQRGRA